MVERDDELAKLRGEKAWLIEALRNAAADCSSDVDGMMDFYLRGVGSRWPELDSPVGDVQRRRLCAHADVHGEGCHWLEPGETCGSNA